MLTKTFSRLRCKIIILALGVHRTSQIEIRPKPSLCRTGQNEIRPNPNIRQIFSKVRPNIRPNHRILMMQPRNSFCKENSAQYHINLHHSKVVKLGNYPTKSDNFLAKCYFFFWLYKVTKVTGFLKAKQFLCKFFKNIVAHLPRFFWYLRTKNCLIIDSKIDL